MPKPNREMQLKTFAHARDNMILGELDVASCEFLALQTGLLLEIAINIAELAETVAAVSEALMEEVDEQR